LHEQGEMTEQTRREQRRGHQDFSQREAAGM
jgi:hypothetical protein